MPDLVPHHAAVPATVPVGVPVGIPVAWPAADAASAVGSPSGGLSGSLFRDLLDLLLPARCAGCRTGHSPLCPSCRAVLRAAHAEPAGPRPPPAGLPPLYAAAPYADPVRQLLLAHKERGALSLAGPLGGALAVAVRAALGHAAAELVPGADAGPVLLVPVPSTRRAVRARGHDPTLRLARAAARELRRGGLRAAVAPVLRHGRAVADQSGLTAVERRRNLHGALTVPAHLAARLTGGRPILVDDLVTTGASLAEAARALGAVGHPPSAAATVAATVRRAPQGAAPGSTGRAAPAPAAEGRLLSPGR
ncbi:ComF family protein [Saccharothrix sp. ST-888]|uniref:ComF family protein n=1 Tax=Saccharothrix sp. ST-888 TaxID=1427391 RepID=UPI000AF5C0E6|nr:ComF family protein [Saccharothrix sp. ST-888]